MGVEPTLHNGSQGLSVEVVVLTAADLVCSHKPHFLQYREMLADPLPREIEAVLNNQARDEREQGLSIRDLEFVENGSTNGMCESFIKVGHCPNMQAATCLSRPTH